MELRQFSQGNGGAHSFVARWS